MTGLERAFLRAVAATVAVSVMVLGSLLMLLARQPVLAISFAGAWLLASGAFTCIALAISVYRRRDDHAA